MTVKSTYAKDDSICIIGAGPGGLSVAYFLQKKGYKNVTVLEKADKVGGLCQTFNFKGKSFDVGANYLTPSYKTILKMARKVGAELYTEKGPIAYNPETGTYSSVFKMVTKDSSVLDFLYNAVRYFFIRTRLNSILKDPSNGALDKHPELMVNFKQWLAKNKLSSLERLFEIPITMMGYGKLDEIPAPYALRYITTGTFRCMLLFGANLPSRYPKRFKYGFQRFWEKISWDMNVILGAHKAHVDRTKSEIEIKYYDKEGKMNDFGESEKLLKCKALIIATPLSDDVLETLMQLNKEEKELFSKVVYNPFAITTIATTPLENDYRVFHIYPINPQGKPSIFARQFPDNPLLTFYTTLSDKRHQSEDDSEKEKKLVLKNVDDLIKKIPAEPIGEYISYDKFPYFPHVRAEEFSNGFYSKLEALQGIKNTYYTGGLMSFELIEPIALYSEKLVEKFF